MMPKEANLQTLWETDLSWMRNNLCFKQVVPLQHVLTPHAESDILGAAPAAEQT